MPNQDLSLKSFYKIGLYLCKQFDQNAFGFGNGKRIYFIDRDGVKQNGTGEDAATFALHNIPVLPGFSMFKNRKAAFVKKKGETKNPSPSMSFTPKFVTKDGEKKGVVDTSRAVRYGEPETVRPFRRPNLP